MKTIIDANVILRYILNDNEAMSAEAKEIIDNKAETLVEVLAEVVYVLKGFIKQKEQISANTLPAFYMRLN